jgi:hypothetical protein
MSDTFTELTNLIPSLGKFRKLIVTFLGTTAPFVVYLTSGPLSADTIVAASLAYVLLNFGVYETKNDAPS